MKFFEIGAEVVYKSDTGIRPGNIKEVYTLPDMSSQIQRVKFKADEFEDGWFLNGKPIQTPMGSHLEEGTIDEFNKRCSDHTKAQLKKLYRL